jgi:hypothetical protein
VPHLTTWWPVVWLGLSLFAAAGFGIYTGFADPGYLELADPTDSERPACPWSPAAGRDHPSGPVT